VWLIPCRSDLILCCLGVSWLEQLVLREEKDEKGLGIGIFLHALDDSPLPSPSLAMLAFMANTFRVNHYIVLTYFIVSIGPIRETVGL